MLFGPERTRQRRAAIVTGCKRADKTEAELCLAALRGRSGKGGVRALVVIGRGLLQAQGGIHGWDDADAWFHAPR